VKKEREGKRREEKRGVDSLPSKAAGRKKEGRDVYTAVVAKKSSRLTSFAAKGGKEEGKEDSSARSFR